MVFCRLFKLCVNDIQMYELSNSKMLLENLMMFVESMKIFTISTKEELQEKL